MRKIQDAEEEWRTRAKDIESGKMQSLLTTLEERGYINQIVGYELYAAGHFARDRLTLLEQVKGGSEQVDDPSKGWSVRWNRPYSAINACRAYGPFHGAGVVLCPWL